MRQAQGVRYAPLWPKSKLGMNDKQKSKAIVVLGMHRSGTSAITHGLGRLGVYLGDDLLPPLPDNPRGFWEDAAILDICERALAALDMSSVSIRMVKPDNWKRRTLSALEEEAGQLLQNRFGGHRLWGFKNPRTARLLPFWQNIFRRLGVEDIYVIDSRNPLSVARSLKQHNGIEEAKTYLLWLEHILSAVSATVGKTRVVVDYDEFMDHPVDQLQRLARALGIEESEYLAQDLQNFATTFLTEELRHTRFSLKERNEDPVVPEFVKIMYEILYQAALGEVSLDSRKIMEWVGSALQTLEAFDPIFQYVEQTEQKYIIARDELTQREQSITALQADVAQRDNRLAELWARLQQLVEDHAGMQRVSHNMWCELPR